MGWAAGIFFLGPGLLGQELGWTLSGLAGRETRPGQQGDHNLNARRLWRAALRRKLTSQTKPQAGTGWADLLPVFTT